jgi:hypothetical protein
VSSEPGAGQLLNPDVNPPPLNFLDFGTSTEAQTLQTFQYLMSSLSGGLTDKQGAAVPYLLKLLRAIKGANLDTLRQVVDEKVKSPSASKFAAAIQTLDPTDQGFFQTVFYHPTMDVTKQAIAWKLYSALSSDAFRQMFSAKQNSVNFDQLIEDRKVVLVKGGRNALGDTGMEIFLQFILTQYFSAGLRRDRIPEAQRHLCLLLADECQKLMGSGKVLEQILVELRKFKCAFIGATQTFHQIADDVRAAVLGATAIRIVGPVSHSDANVMAREMFTTPDFIRSMASYERRGAEWCVHVSPSKKAMKVFCPYGVLEKMPKRKLPPPEPTPSSAPISPPQPEAAAVQQQPNELSLHDTDSPLPEQQPIPPSRLDPAMHPEPSPTPFEIKPGKPW